ncbi:hypothetical protein FACS1894193_03040 [Bacilli bacterium]|nr:hypothetical protein FACS1894192_06060 [Bacilli bacterium]GHU40573.1 hypothetical protein FACS1894193_03040 [Bacilli bacterium]GHU46058.1 hypothetical protein FACS1894194_3070 [Bacilli bacterium]
MSLVVLIGAQAVGKMTVGRELEKQIDGKLLYNHQTIDLFANFLGYTPTTFQLSDELRKSLFQAFVNNLTTNPVNHLIFTVMIDFASDEDLAFFSEIAAIFLNAGESVYFVELVAEMSERRVRNTHPERLAAKPSKRDLAFSMQDLEQSAVNYQLESKENQLAESFPEVQVLKIDNSHLSPEAVVQQVLQVFPRLK